MKRCTAEGDHAVRDSNRQRSSTTWQALSRGVLLVIGLLVAGCDYGAARFVSATLMRTACFGECPSYKVTVKADGTVEYQGYDYVKRLGVHREPISEIQIVALRYAFLRASFFSLEQSHNRSFDASEVEVTYSAVGHTKVVTVDHMAPHALYRLAADFERIVGTEKWVGREDERVSQPLPSWWPSDARR